MADAKRIRTVATFKTAKVTAKLRRVKTQAWKIVAREADVIVHATIGKKVGRGAKGKIRSQPGEPPRRDRSFLYNNTEVAYDPKRSRMVLKTPLYGAYLHGGTRSILPRPWINVLFNRQGNLQKTWRKRATQVMKTLAGR